MQLDLTDSERNLLQKIMESYRSELRQSIAATRGTGELRAEEDMIRPLGKLTRT